LKKVRKQLQHEKIRGADAKAQSEVKDANTWDCYHYNNQEVSDMNKVRLQILSSKNSTCEVCEEDSSTNQGSEGHKVRAGKVKKKKKGGGARGTAGKEQVKAEKNLLWVCLQCSRHFCGGPNSNPRGHAMAHCRENRHWWAA